VRLEKKSLEITRNLIKRMKDDTEASVSIEAAMNLVDTIEALQQENEQLQAQVAELRDNLKWLKSISFSHEDDLERWPSQETRESIEYALSESAGMDYHNPADVETLRKVREALILSKIHTESCFTTVHKVVDKALTAIDKAIGG